MAGLWKYFSVVILSLMGLPRTGADYADLVVFLQEQSKNETFVRLYEQHAKYFQDDSNNLKGKFVFNCKTYPRPKTLATSVHELTPMDIKVVAALGDSITAGTGITAATPIGLLRQDRQLSWSIGGEGDIYEEKTLPNILKVYNPDITGYSTGWGPVEFEFISHLNVAHPGDKSEDIPGQAELLVKRMKDDGNVDMENDWKMITLFVGGNDLCDLCEDKEKYKAENYVANIQKALDYLQEKVPRAFVNLVQVLDIAIVKKLNGNLICDALHLYGCRCAAFPRNSDAEKELQAETERYRELTEKLIMSGRYDTKDDFTVILQPFFSKTVPPNKEGSDEPDLSYFAPDCFHLSLKGHRAATEALWDNMVEPVGLKRNAWTPNEKLECPTESKPYFTTYVNSGPKAEKRESHSLGAINENEKDDSGLSSNKGYSKSQGQSSSLSVIAIVTGAAVVLVGAVVIVVLMKRRKQGKKEEREILLQKDGLMILSWGHLGKLTTGNDVMTLTFSST